jgi:hypothetical protein
VYRVAAINPEFYNYFSKWHSTDENHPISVKKKKKLQMNTSRINLYYKMAVSNDDSLDLGPVPLGCLCHGFPVEGPHHLLDPMDQGLGFVVRLCLDP